MYENNRSCIKKDALCNFENEMEQTMKDIVDVHYPGIKKKLVGDALTTFYSMRELPGMKKKPSTSELLDWLKLLMNTEKMD